MTINHPGLATDGQGNILPNERRLAFRRMSTLYPVILHTIASENCSLKKTDDQIFNPTPGQIRSIVQVLAALFAVRMLKSRLNFEIQNIPDPPTKHMTAFAEWSAVEYANFRDRLFPQHAIIMSKPHTEALAKIEQGMVDCVFQAFITDASFEGFAEDAFWQDVFRGIADNPNGADLMRGFEAGWLRHMPGYMEALRADNEGPEPQAVVVTNTGPGTIQ